MIVGQTNDGVFARHWIGIFTSPCGEYWGSTPYTKEQKKANYEYKKESKRINQLIELGIDCREKVIKEIEQIENNTSVIPKRLRKYLMERFKMLNK